MPQYKKSRVAETTAYDPRFDRAQTVDGATARYVAHDTDYDLEDFERDVARLLTEGAHPDKPDRPTFSGQRAV